MYALFQVSADVILNKDSFHLPLVAWSSFCFIANSNTSRGAREGTALQVISSLFFTLLCIQFLSMHMQTLLTIPARWPTQAKRNIDKELIIVSMH